MSRVWLVPVVALVGLFVPSVVQAQTYVIPSCTDPAVMSRSSYDRAVPCVPLVPVPPTGVPTWLRPAPIAPPPAVTYPAPVYAAPVPAPRGLDPWIPLAVRPAPAPSSSDLLTQMILLQQLAAARRARAHAAPPPVQRPAPAPPAAPGENWMRGFFKGVKE